MSPIVTFIVFQCLIILPFGIGSLMRKSIEDPQGLSKKSVKANLIFLESPVIFWTIWALEIRGEFVYLPAAGLLLVLAGIVLGRLALPFLGLKGKRSRATYLIGASLANHGFTMGGFLCYLFLGQTGLGMASLFIVYFIPYTFGAMFWYAGAAGSTIPRAGFRGLISGIQFAPLFAAVAAIVLRLAGVMRPAWAVPAEYPVMASVALYYWALGLSFDISAVRGALRAHAALGAIKFLILPAAAFMALRAAGLGSDVASVIQIQSFMPAAIYSVITAVLFDLDARLASSLFVVNTLAFLLIILPLLLLLRHCGVV